MIPGINRSTLLLFSAALLLVLTILVGVNESSLASPGDGIQSSHEAVESAPLIRLRYATFDPLAGEPSMPQGMRLAKEGDGNGPFIVQFAGPVQTAWKIELERAGVQLGAYLPDYAFVARMDATAKAAVEQLGFVRWIGMFHPAYKMAPGLAPSETGLYRIFMAEWAERADVTAQLGDIGVDAAGSGRAIIMSAPFERLPRIAALPDVIWIEPFRFFESRNDRGTAIMGALPAWNAGFTGNGQMVTIADTGIDTGVDAAALGDIHADFDQRVSHISSWPVVTAPGCITNPGDDDDADDEDSGHGTHVAGSVAGNGDSSAGLHKGPAYEATMTFQAVEQWTTWTGACAAQVGTATYSLSGIPDDLKFLFQEAYDWGSRIHTNSWGSDVAGEYDLSSRQVDLFVWNHKDFTVLFAAGNAGIDGDGDGFVDEDSMGSPATAKNAITIGASESDRGSGGYNPGGPCSTYFGCWGSDYPVDPTKTDPLSDSPAEMAAFSSRGPTDDGRIKPDLVAPGTNILSTRSSVATENGWGTPPNAYYMYMGGTSMATPLAAGAATVVRDYLVDGEGMPNPSAALIKAILINSAVDINGYGFAVEEAGLPIPNNHEGWGRIDLTGAISATNRGLVDGQSLNTGVTHSYHFTATNSASPLKVSLVWSDYPGTPGSGAKLVNDLNLKLTAPDGSTTYLGNQFNNGWSVTGGSADGVNNVENVYIQAPVTGTWTIDVIGFNVPQPSQAYALVIDGEGSSSGPPRFDNEIFLPVTLKSGQPGPRAGNWLSGTSEEFYVMPDQSHIDQFSVLVNVSGFSDPSCNGLWRIIHTTPEPITNNQFSFSGAFSATGNFSSETAVSGTDALNSFPLPNCGTISGGPWSYSATWQNNSQPALAFADTAVEAVLSPAGASAPGDVFARKVDAAEGTK
jgi:subtilisin family serine protease